MEKAELNALGEVALDLDQSGKYLASKVANGRDAVEIAAFYRKRLFDGHESVCKAIQDSLELHEDDIEAVSCLQELSEVSPRCHYVELCLRSEGERPRTINAIFKYAFRFQLVELTSPKFTVTELNRWLAIRNQSAALDPPKQPGILRRKEIIEMLRPHWQKIVSDLRHASDNDLKLARAGVWGYWDLEKVEAWGRSEGRLPEKILHEDCA